MLLSTYAEISACPSASKMKAVGVSPSIGMVGYLSSGHPLLALLQRSGSAVCWCACPKSSPRLQQEVQLCHLAGVAGGEASPELCHCSSNMQCSNKKRLNGASKASFVTWLSAQGCLGCVCQALAGVVQRGHCPDLALLCSAVPVPPCANKA